MHDTVTKILALADEYANFAYLGDQDSRYNARQALQDELAKLFTPLTDEQIHNADPLPNAIFIDRQRVEFARALERLHGITGEKNETDE